MWEQEIKLHEALGLHECERGQRVFVQNYKCQIYLVILIN